jgi:hypothetical protein
MARITAISLFGFISALAAGLPAFGQANMTERPWVDVTKFPLDAHELNAAKVTASSSQPGNHLFVLVKSEDGNKDSSIATSYGSSVVVTTTGGGNVQIGNGRTVRTFHIQTGLSQCYAQITVIGCNSNGRTEEVRTPVGPGGS